MLGDGVVPLMKQILNIILSKLKEFQQLALVPMGTFLLSASTSLTVKLVVAFLIEDAVIICLLEGEPLAVLNVIALFNAELKGFNGK